MSADYEAEFGTNPTPKLVIEVEHCDPTTNYKALAEQFRRKHSSKNLRLPIGPYAYTAAQIKRWKDDSSLDDVSTVQLPPPLVTDWGTLDDRLAPGCFGSALTFKPDSPECNKCLFAPRCEVISNDRARRLFRKLGADPRVLAAIEVERERKRRNKQSQYQRDRRRCQEQTRVARSAQPINSVTREEIIGRRDSFKVWLSQSGSRQSQCRKRAPELMWSWIALEVKRRELGRDPTPSEYAEILTLMLKRRYTRSQGQKRLGLLLSFEQPGGPWCEAKA